MIPIIKSFINNYENYIKIFINILYIYYKMNNENSNNDNYEKYKLIRHYENKINDFDKDRDTHYNTFKNKVYRLTDI